MGLSWLAFAQNNQQSATQINPFPNQILGLSFGIGTQSTPYTGYTFHVGAEYFFSIDQTDFRKTHLGFDLSFQNERVVDIWVL